MTDEVQIPETVEPIIAWVRQQHPTTAIGECINPEMCLIATYLGEKYPEYAFEVVPLRHETGEVYWCREEELLNPKREWLAIHNHPFRSYATLSPALNALANKFDTMATGEQLEQGGEAAMVTAGEFLTKWEGNGE